MNSIVSSVVRRSVFLSRYAWLAGVLAVWACAVASTRAQTQAVDPGARVNPVAKPTPPAPPAQPGLTNPAAEGMPKISFTETTHDFGEIWLGEPLEHYFAVRNDGTGSLQITDVKASCGCTAIPDYTKVIAPGETGKVGARLDSTKIGTGVVVPKTITVTSNDPTQPSTILTIKALVKAFVQVEPKMLNLGNLSSPDQEVSGQITITNNTNEPLTLEADPVTPVTGSDRFMAGPPEEVEKGKIFKITVKGVTPFTEGQMRSIFRYRTNIQKQATVDFTAFAMLPQRLQLNPPQLWVTAAQPTAQTRPVQLINNGKQPITVTSAEVDDPDVKVSFNEQQTPQPPQPPGQQPGTRQTWVIKVEFPPNYAPPAEPGRTLTIKTDDSEKPVFSVAIRGPMKPVQPPQRKPMEDLVGKPAPAVEIRSLAGESHMVGSGENPVSVLVFYTTWCPHCKKEMPVIQKVYEAYKEKSVRVIGVSLDDIDRKTKQPFTAEALAGFVKQYNLTFPIAHDPGHKVGAPYKVNGFPCTFLINKAGIVESVYPGEVAENVLRGELDRMLAGKPKEPMPIPQPIAPVEATQKPAPPAAAAGTQTPGQ